VWKNNIQKARVATALLKRIFPLAAFTDAALLIVMAVRSKILALLSKFVF
jgi:hypothetical protein